MPRPIATFRIHPCIDVPSRYVVVQVFRTFGEMRAFLVARGGVTISASGRTLTSKSRYDGAQGVCRYDPKERQIATVSLVEGHCGPRIVCHEFTHAATAYAIRHLYTKDAPLDSLLFGPAAERLAHFHGNLSSTFWHRYRAAGLRE